MKRTPTFHPQTGGITILVCLMLLVLLTVAAFGMSRNSLREVIIAGTSRQGSMARNVADSGIEWSLYWLNIDNQVGAADPEGLQFLTLYKRVLADPTKKGQSWDAVTQSAYTPGSNTLATLNNPASLSGTSQTFSVGLTHMGSIDKPLVSQTSAPGGYSPAAGGATASAPIMPNVLAIRSDSQVTVAGVTFTHGKEAWITTPIQ
ncbi:MAG: hypothetical protein LWX11_05140 [Firmicutes bacterium]|nr:hypothetical protein [Bacillota bacterium]